MNGPLAGRTIVVTRASGQAGRFSAMLREAGAEVIEVPLISVVDAPDAGAALGDALARLDDYDWVVVTSPNGASRVAPALAARPPGAGPRIAAVGRATSAALGPRTADLVPARQIAEALVEAFPDGRGRVLVVQGVRARPAVSDGLTAKGWSVDRVDAYDTVPCPIAPGLADAIASADAITLLSGSAASSLADARRTSGLALPARVVSIGPVTSAVARANEINVTATAHVHTLRGTLAAVVQAVT